MRNCNVLFIYIYSIIIMIEGDTWHQVDSDSEQPDSQEGGSDSDKEEDNVNVEYKWTRRARRQRQYKGIKSVQVRLLIATFRTS